MSSDRAEGEGKKKEGRRRKVEEGQWAELDRGGNGGVKIQDENA